MERWTHWIENALSELQTNFQLDIDRQKAIGKRNSIRVTKQRTVASELPAFERLVCELTTSAKLQ